MTTQPEHPIFFTIVDFLKESGVWHETFLHETTVRTSEEAAALRPGYTLTEGAKALIVRVKNSHKGKHFVQIVLPGDKKFDAKKFKTLLQSSDIRFATTEEVDHITGGIQPGGVPPFGKLFAHPIDIYVDQEVFSNERIIFNAGRNASVAMKSTDYKTLLNPIVADLC